jgi:hypothetical protein
MGTAADYAKWIVANKDKKGTPEFETVARAYQQAKARRGLPEYVDEGPSEEFLAFRGTAGPTIGGSFRRGLESLLSSYQTAGGAAFGSPEEAAQAAMERSQSMQERLGPGASFGRLKDIYEREGLLPAIGAGIGQLPASLAEQAPQLGVMAAGAAAGQAAIPVPFVGAGLGALATLVPQFLGYNIERQAEEDVAAGRPVDIEMGKALGTAALQSVPELAGTYLTFGKTLLRPLLKVAEPEKLTGRAAAQAVEELTKKAEESLFKQTIPRGIARGAAAEMPTEVAQQVLERWQAGLDVLSPEAMAEYGEAAYLAGTIGGALGPIGRISERADARRQLRDYEEQGRAAMEAAKRLGRGEAQQLEMFPPAEADAQIVGPLEPADARATRMAGTEGTIPLLIDRGDDLSQYSDAMRKAIEEGRTFQYETGAESDLNQLDIFRDQPTLLLSGPDTQDTKRRARIEQEVRFPTRPVTPVSIDEAEAAAKEYIAPYLPFTFPDGYVAKTTEQYQARVAEKLKARADAQARGELFTPEEAPVPEPPLRTATRDWLVSMGVRPRAGMIIGTKNTPSIVGKDLTDPVQRGEVVDALVKYLPSLKDADQAGVRRNVMRNIQLLEDLGVDTDKPLAPRASPQMDIEEQIAESKRQEAAAGEAKTFEGSPERQVDAIYRAKEELRAQQEALDRAAQPEPGTPTAMERAMQAGQQRQARGQVVRGQAQLEAPGIPLRDQTVQEIADEQRRLEAEQAATPAGETAPEQGPLTEQGELIGPRGGPRTSMKPKAAPVKKEPVDGEPVDGEPVEEAIPEDAPPVEKKVVKESAAAKKARERAAANLAENQAAKAQRKEAIRKEGEARRKAMEEAPPVEEAPVEEAPVGEPAAAGEENVKAASTEERKNNKSQREMPEVVVELQGSNNDALRYYSKGRTEINDVLGAIVEDLESTDQNVKGRALKAVLGLEESAPNLAERLKLIFVSYRKELGRPNLPVNAVVRSALAVDTDVDAALRKNSLSRAFEIMAKSSDPTIARVAAALQKVVGTTSVRFEANLVNEKGESIAGTFDPKTNTIILNDDFAPTNHVVMHEMLHAATSAELANPSSPITKQLQKLFNDVKDRLDTAYGATDLNEFVAEAFSNPEFQAKLAAIDTKGDKLGIWERFKNIIRNLIRKVRGLPFEKIDSVRDKVDQLVMEMLAPAPEYRNATRMNSATLGQRAGELFEDLGKFSKGEISAEDIRTYNDFMPTVSSNSRKAILSILPLDAIGRYIKPRFPELSAEIDALFKIIQKKNGARQLYLTKVRDTANQLEKVFKGKKELKEAWNEVIMQSTMRRVDPSKPRSYYEQYRLSYMAENYESVRRGFNTKEERDAEIKKLADAYTAKYGEDATFVYRTQNPTESLLQEYDQLRKDYWDPMLKMEGGANAAKAYETLRDAYSSAYTDLRKMLQARIDALSTSDAGLKQTYRDKILVDLLNKESIEPYFPLYRKGDFWITYSAVDPYTGELAEWKEAFETDAQRRERLRELEADKETYSDINELERPTDAERRKNPFAAVDSKWGYSLLTEVQVKANKRIKDMEKSMREAGKSDAEIKKAIAAAREGNRSLERVVLDALIDAMPERSLHRSFTRRKNTLGAEKDALAVFRKRMPAFLGQLTNIEYDIPLSEARTKLLKTPAKYPDASRTEAREIAEHAAQYIDFVRNPQLSSWSRWLKSAGFMWTLGVNVSSAVVNTMILPVVVYPYLGGKYGWGNAFKAMNNARKLYFQTGTRRQLNLYEGMEGGTAWDGPGFQNLDFEDPSTIPEAFKQSPEELARNKVLSEVIKTRGMANVSTVQDMLDMSDPSSDVMTKVNTVMGFMFHQGERLNRQVTLKATYDLILDEKAKKGKPLTEQDYYDAADQAVLETEHMNSGAMTETAPRIAQKDLTSVLLMYKRFGVSMYFLQFSMARDLLKSADPEVRKQAKRQLVGLFASSGLLAGVQGLPLYGVISAIANMFLLDDEDDDFDSIAASYFGEGAYSGLINAITGADVAPRIGMSNLIYRSLPNKEYESLSSYLMEQAGGPLLGIGLRMERGLGLMADGEFERGLESMLPSGLSNPLKSIRYATEGATTLRGDPILDDIGPMSLLGQFFGFAPDSYTRQLATNARDKRVDRKLSEKRTKLLRERYMAIREGDYDVLQDVDREIDEFSRRHPEIAITPTVKRRSIAQHKVTDEVTRMLNGITVNPRRIEAVVRKRLAETGDDEFYK